jgi:hypothetical protein
MYLITANNGELHTSEGRDSLDKARELAENWAKLGYTNVEVWLRIHSVEIQPQAVWTNHAKALSGQE